jgi:hypothetical protein
MVKKNKTKTVAVAGDEELGRVAYNVFRADVGSPVHWENLSTAGKVGWMRVAKAVRAHLRLNHFFEQCVLTDADRQKLRSTRGLSARTCEVLGIRTSPRPSPHSAKAGTRRGGSAASVVVNVKCSKCKWAGRFSMNPRDPKELEKRIDIAHCEAKVGTECNGKLTWEK